MATAWDANNALDIVAREKICAPGPNTNRSDLYLKVA
jgi:hypothetical protein